MCDFFFFFVCYQNKGLTIANPDLICSLDIFSYSDSVTCVVVGKSDATHMEKGYFVGFERRDGPCWPLLAYIHETKVIQYLRTCDPDPYNITVSEIAQIAKLSHIIQWAVLIHRAKYRSSQMKFCIGYTCLGGFGCLLLHSHIFIYSKSTIHFRLGCPVYT